MNSRNIVSRHVAASTRLARRCDRLQYKSHKLTTLFFTMPCPQKGTKLNLPAASTDGGLTVEKGSHFRIAFLRARGRNCDGVSVACGVQRAEH
jgi:hypothetical protein